MIRFFANAGRAVFRTISGNIQTYLQGAAGLSNLAVVVWVITIAAEPRWALADKQLQILLVLGVLSSLTNAVVVIALSRVNVSAQGPGNMHFDVDTGGSAPAMTATAEVKVGPTT